jgi:hypothetical protein
MILRDKALLKDYAISFGQVTHTKNSRETALLVSNTLFYAFIELFLFNFSNYISTMIKIEESEKSYILMRLIYKFLFSYIQNIPETHEININGEHILPFLNNEKFDNFIIGNNNENIENLHIFNHLKNTFRTVNCIIGNFLKPERVTILCSELDNYLTKNIPLNNLKDYKFLTDGCIKNILFEGLSIELVSEIYYYLYPKE